VRVVRVSGERQLKTRVAAGTLQGGVVVPDPVAAGRHETLADLLTPVVALGTGRRGDGFVVVDSPGSLVGTEMASSIASGIAGQAYAGALRAAVTGPDGAVASANPPAAATEPPTLEVTTRTLGNGGRAALDYFAPSIAVIFLFITAGLGTRSLLMERAEGTLVRLAAAPVRPGAVVAGKLLAILATSLASILVMWGATAALFRADWGDPAGVLLMCVGAALAMTGISVFLTSLAKDERQAFGISLVVGLLLALFGGNLVPPGALPGFLQVLSLGTPNGWTLVGFGRLSLQHQAAGAAVGPFVVLCVIAAVAGALAATRVRRMVES
jgi:ABC-2 type transport system permease protein